MDKKTKFDKAGSAATGYVFSEEEATSGIAEKHTTKKMPAKKPDKETRTRRVQLVIQPTLYDAIREKAHDQYISTNEAIIRAIQKYTK